MNELMAIWSVSEWSTGLGVAVGLGVVVGVGVIIGVEVCCSVGMADAVFSGC